MPYSNMQMPQQPANNLWFGNNYSGGYSGYPQPQQANYQRMPQQQPQRIDNIINVMGVAGANNFAVGPNSRVIMMDSEHPVVFLKRSDDSGYSVLKAYAMTEIPLDSLEPHHEQNYTEPTLFVTKDDFNDAIRELKSSIHSLEEAVTSA